METYDPHCIMRDIYLDLLGLQLVHKVNGKLISFAPDNM